MDSHLQNTRQENLQLAKSNQELQIELQFVMKVNRELELSKGVGVRSEEDVQEMMREVAAWKQGGVQECLQQVEREAEMKQRMRSVTVF